jgi:glycosyltransferase involved in cell wall biosynthesis
MKVRISVVIATTAEKKRAESIDRAINSVIAQQGCNFNLIVVINGEIFDDDVRKSIEDNKLVQCHYLLEGSFPKALAYARSVIKTDYFCFLDDDDELLPSSLFARFSALECNPNMDVAVGNGLKKHSDFAWQTHPNILSYQGNSLAALLKENGNWLASCAGMFRTETIPQQYFDDYAVYAEWSYIAFKLAIFNKVIFINCLCYCINVQSESLSHNEAYLLGQYDMTRKVLILPLPMWAKKLLLIKVCDTEHTISERFLKNKQSARAWLFHLRSLSNTKTFFKYILFTRYLIFQNLTNKH